jgi:hypothetical protein
MASLTGTKIRDTYDSLIKVSDNGALDGTLQTLTDGLGNDSALSLSTAGASVTGTLSVSGSSSSIVSVNTTSAIGTAVPFAQSGTNIGWVGNGSSSFIGASTSDFGINSQGNLLFGQGGFERMRIDSSGAASITGSLTTTAKTLAERVQVGTAATLNDATGVGNTLQFANYSPSAFVTGSADSYIYKNSSVFGGLAAQSLVFQTRSDVTGGGFSFVAGAPPAVVANINSNGLSFNGDTAAANALDDYEEGTFDATVVGSSTAGTVTHYNRLGLYTKIGRMVTFNLYLNWDSGTGTGNLYITGLPFTANGATVFPSVTIGECNNISLTADHIPMARITQSTDRIEIVQSPVGGGTMGVVPYDAAGYIMLSGSYFV